MLKVDCRGARRRAGMTQAAWADAIYLSLDRVRALDYQGSANLPSLETAYRMAVLAGLLAMEGPQGPVGMAPLHRIAHPEAQSVVPMVTLTQEIPGQLSFWGRPVIVHVADGPTTRGQGSHSPRDVGRGALSQGRLQFLER